MRVQEAVGTISVGTEELAAVRACYGQSMEPLFWLLEAISKGPLGLWLASALLDHVPPPIHARLVVPIVRARVYGHDSGTYALALPVVEV